MAKLDSKPITKPDLIEYLDRHSDFSFEIKTLNTLIGLGCACEHGGSYDDPVTQKPRQFDIRATLQFENRFLRLAVECKNIRSNNPLLVSCLPRRDEEAFNVLSYSDRPRNLAPVDRWNCVTLRGAECLYPTGDPVGKACEQVGRVEQSNEIKSRGSDVYDKWSQALSSAEKLTRLACTDGGNRTSGFALSLVMPFVVVPDGRLWRTVYDAEGNRIEDPKPIERCSYLVNRTYYTRSGAGRDAFVISHLEFVTSTGLVNCLDGLCGDEPKLKVTFPESQILNLLRNA